MGNNGPYSETIAVFGGSFDPPHLAHAMVAVYVLSAYPLDRLIFVPAYRHPFAKPLAPYQHRVRMCELAVADIGRVEVSRIEKEMGGESLTLRTLEELQRRNRSACLRLVIGSDLLQETSRWHNFERIRQIARPIIVARGGYTDAEVQGPVLPEISSTEARRRIREGLATEGWLGHSVARYIRSHGLYRD